jgi:apolipoprotein N-acyltransferase
VLGRRLIAGWGFALALLAGFLIYGFVRMGETIPVKDHLKVVLVQQNVDSWLAGPSTERQMLLTGEELSEAGVRAMGSTPDLIVWSEESLLRPYRYFKSFYAKEPPSDPFLGFLKRVKAPVLLGAPYVVSYDKQEFLNASILLNSRGELLDYYGKRRLVPFAEYIPFWDVGFVRHFMEDVIGLGGVWTPGTRNTIFTLPLQSGGSVRFGTPICFEDSFSGIARDFYLGGADLLINLTNTSWSDTVSAETQQFVAARYLSVETKRVMIRSTNSGLTSIIDPWGRVTASLPLFKSDFLTADVPVYDNGTLTSYTLYGDYLPLALALVLLLVLWFLSGYRPIGRRSETRRS